MGIPESQLQTWSHQGAIAGSSSTYATVKQALESATTAYASRNYKVFLQGSYCNYTNIWSESDVDVVIRLDASFRSDLGSLPPAQKLIWSAAYADATYNHPEFKADVLKALQKAFPGAVTPGAKAFTIAAFGNRRKADVIPALAYRRYYKFNGIYDQSYDEGICFWDKTGTEIANYPLQHSLNLTKKHKSSGLRLKPTIRVLKNLRSRLIAEGLLLAGSAPSYYIEGLLYNVPDDKFSSSISETVVAAMNWILEADRTAFVTANEQYYLLREGHKTCWSTKDGEAFINAVVTCWNGWKSA